MQKAYILLFLGIWVAILSYLGFPASWKGILFPLSGLAIIYVSFLLYQEAQIREGSTNIFDTFKENEFEGEDK